MRPRSQALPPARPKPDPASGAGTRSTPSGSRSTSTLPATRRGCPAAPAGRRRGAALLAMALAAGAVATTALPAGASTTPDPAQIATTTQKLSGGYSSADQGTATGNPVTDQVTAMLSAGATRPCSNQRACDAAGQVSTAPADNVGTGRLRTNRQQGHAALDRTVESGSRITLATPSFASVGSTPGQAAPGGSAAPTGTAPAGTPEPSATPTGAAAAPAFTVSDTVGYQRTTAAEPDGTGSVSHTLTYKAEVPAAPQDKTDPWTSFGTTAPGEGERTCIGSLTFSYDSGGDLDSIVFTHATEGTAQDGIPGVTSGAAVTTIVTTTLEVPLLSDTDREVATSYARHAALSSGSLTVPLTALDLSDSPGQGFADIVSAHATATRQILEGTAIKDKGGPDALAPAWSTSQLTTGYKQLALQDL